MTRRIGRALFAVPLVLGVLAIVAGGEVGAAERTVVVLPTTGTVDNVMAGYLSEGIAKASRQGAQAVVIRLNTPGGSLEATQSIVSSLLEAPLPVIVWVAPSGARAASAGTFITLASHVAVMAPGSNIGAASPVGGQGEDIPGTLGEKVKNDAIANIRSIAETRGRNQDWAASTVSEAKSSAASEALSAHAIDAIAATLPEVLAAADGREVKVHGTTVKVDTAGAATEEVGMNPFQSFLHLLSDPNIAFILFTVGFYGLLFELQSPNFVTGILGALAIILAFVGFGSLPLNVAGLILIGLAMVLFLLEFTVTSHGLLAVGGIICFALGASALYTEPGNPTAPAIEVDPRVIFSFTALTAAYVALVLTVVVRWRRRQRNLGPISTELVVAEGATGAVRSALAPVGVVYAAGEEWTARSGDGRALVAGTPVRVIGQDGLTLIVEPLGAAPPSEPLDRPREAPG
ncbi:MAG: NfeD family protein [Chloroflexota bacterium]